MAALTVFSGECERDAVTALLHAVAAAAQHVPARELPGDFSKRRAAVRDTATLVISHARLIKFSSRAARAVSAACDGGASRLVVDPTVSARARKGLSQIFATSGPAALLDAPLSAPASALLKLVEAAASRSGARFEWIETVLVDALVHGTAGCLLSADSAASAPTAQGIDGRALLPPALAHMEHAFRVWLPLLFGIEIVTPGFARLLLRALVAPDVNNELATAWVVLLRSRYWASLFDWSLAVAPRRRAAASRHSTEKSSGCTHVILHERHSWTREEACWAFSEAPAACLLGLEQAASGHVSVDFNKSLVHFLSSEDDHLDGALCQTTAGSTWYSAALRLPPLYARVSEGPPRSAAPAERKLSWDLEEFERLVQGGGATEPAPRNQMPISKRPRWTI
jgi:hypothetical protein